MSLLRSWLGSLPGYLWSGWGALASLFLWWQATGGAWLLLLAILSCCLPLLAVRRNPLLIKE